MRNFGGVSDLLIEASGIPADRLRDITPPKYLVRYRKSELDRVTSEIDLACKETPEVFASPVAGFSDQTEVRPRIVTSSDQDIGMALQKNWLELRNAASFKDYFGQFGLIPEAFHFYHELSLRHRIIILNEFDKFSRYWLEVERNSTRVACFNTDMGNPAFWDYYAEGGRGICLIFKRVASLSDYFISLPYTNESFSRTRLRPVCYSQTRPQIRTEEIIRFMGRAIDHVRFEDGVAKHDGDGILSRMYATKKKHYSSESEWRLYSNTLSGSLPLFGYELQGIVIGDKCAKPLSEYVLEKSELKKFDVTFRNPYSEW